MYSAGPTAGSSSDLRYLFIVDRRNIEPRLLDFLLVSPRWYARVAFGGGGWLIGLGSLMGVYLLVGLRTVPNLGGELGDVPRFVVFGVVRAALLGLILWAIGTQYHDKEVPFWAVLWAVSAAHLPLLARLIVPGLVGTILTLIWFLVALGAATQAVLDLERRTAAATGLLAVCGLIIIMAATPVDLSGVPPL